jgi:hypothetical protein
MPDCTRFSAVDTQLDTTLRLLTHHQQDIPLSALGHSRVEDLIAPRYDMFARLAETYHIRSRKLRISIKEILPRLAQHIPQTTLRIALPPNLALEQLVPPRIVVVDPHRQCRLPTAQACQREMQALIEGVRPFHDIGIVARPERSESERFEAAMRIVKRLGKVIHPKRMSAIEHEARQQAEFHHGGNVAEEIRQRTITALVEFVLEHYGDMRSWPCDTVYRRLRRRLQAVVTEDFLGPKWTRCQRRKPQQEGDRIIVPPREILVPLEALLNQPYNIEDLPIVDDLIRSATLSPREAEIFTLLSKGDSISEIATHLGITQDTLYWHHCNIRKRFSRCH